MKKILIVMLAQLVFITSYAQSVEREKVILEISTGTDCGSCPGAMIGAEELIENGKDVAVIEYHNYNTSDPFNNSYAAARWDYYNMIGAPISFFDGTLMFIGGGYDISNYEDYLPLYYQRKAIPSDFVIEVVGNSPNQEYYMVNVTVNNVNNNTSGNLCLQAVITESNIPYNWQNQTMMNFVERRMMPDENGTELDFSGVNSITTSFEFTLDADWVAENCKLVLFIQNNSNREILQGKEIDLIDFFAPLDYNVTLKEAYVPRALCASTISPKIAVQNNGMEALTSFDIEYQLNEGEIQNYNWTGNLEFMEFEFIELPEYSITNISDTNTFEFTVSNPNGSMDEYPDDNDKSKLIFRADEFPNPPNISLYIKTDDYPEETTWELKDGNGSVIAEGGPYDLSNHLYQTNFEIDELDCYSFTIYDEAGDGLSSSESAKYFITTNGNLYYTSKLFGYMEETQFSVSITGVENTAFESDLISISPNPVTDYAIIRFNDTYILSDAEINVYNVLGKNIFTKSLHFSELSNSQLLLDTHSYHKGVYFLSLQINNEKIIKKFLVN